MASRQRSSSLGSGKGASQLDEHWEVGGKYQIKRDTLPMWAGPQASDEVIGELHRDDVVLLLRQVQAEGRPPSGFVLPAGGQLGWIALEDWFSAGAGPVHKVKMPGSWIMGARYLVISEATVREERMLASDWVAELAPGEEVLALELMVNDGDDEDHKVRLRMKIGTDSGIVGWISPQTPRGEMLLHPMNLLGMELVDIVRKTSSSGSRKSWGSGGGGHQDIEEAMTTGLSGKRKSYQPGVTMPWDIDGQYRVLAATKLKETHLGNGKDLCRIPAGALATVHRLELGPTDLSPVAFVTVQANGYLDGCKGWMRCTSKEGHDVLDFRDQHQLKKVMQHVERIESDKRAAQAEQERACPFAGGEEADAEARNKEAVVAQETTEEQKEPGNGEEEELQEQDEEGADDSSRRRPEERPLLPSAIPVGGVAARIGGSSGGSGGRSGQSGRGGGESASAGAPCFGGCLVALHPFLEGALAKAREAQASRRREE